MSSIRSTIDAAKVEDRYAGALSQLVEGYGGFRSRSGGFHRCPGTRASYGIDAPDTQGSMTSRSPSSSGETRVANQTSSDMPSGTSRTRISP